MLFIQGKIFFVLGLLAALRMGNREGMTGNELKSQCHEVWMQDKLDQEHLVKVCEDVFCSFVCFVCFFVSLFFFCSWASSRLDWFVFENVPEYPTDYLRPLEQKYAYEETLISPQRFGKPMNRPLLPKQKHVCIYPFTFLYL
jgi:hypothetical protein